MTRLTRLMDSRFRLPGTNFRFGLDPIVGLIPGAGDIATGAISAYILYEARRLNLPKRTMTKMIGNVVIDFAIGSIPLLGDLFDFGFKANQRNLRLLERTLKE